MEYKGGWKKKKNDKEKGSIDRIESNSIGEDLDGGQVLSNVSPLLPYLRERDDGSFFQEVSGRKYEELIHIVKNPGFSLSNKSNLIRLSRAHGYLIFIRAVKKYTTAQTIYISFKQFGEILHLHFPFNEKKKVNIGYGYIAFMDPLVGKYVLDKIKYLSIDGKKVRICRFVEKTKKEGTSKSSLRDISESEGSDIFQLQSKREKIDENITNEKQNNSIENEKILEKNRKKELFKNTPQIKPTRSLYHRHYSSNLRLSHSYLNIEFKLLSSTYTTQRRSSQPYVQIGEDRGINPPQFN